ncbi:MAG: hypothetical protein ACYSU7_15990 [Planctomycetota bacterium]|jgi:hypothetical protein
MSLLRSLISFSRAVSFVLRVSSSFSASLMSRFVQGVADVAVGTDAVAGEPALQRLERVRGIPGDIAHETLVLLLEVADHGLPPGRVDGCLDGLDLLAVALFPRHVLGQRGLGGDLGLRCLGLAGVEDDGQHQQKDSAEDEDDQ